MGGGGRVKGDFEEIKPSLRSPVTITMALILDFPLFCGSVQQLRRGAVESFSIMIEEEEEEGVEGKEGVCVGGCGS